MAVCDAYEGMTSDRPYRRALGHAHAFHELRAMAGTQFDPQVVTAFVDALEHRDLATQPDTSPIHHVTTHVRSLLAQATPHGDFPCHAHYPQHLPI